MSNIQSLEEIRRNRESAPANAPRDGRQADSGSLIPATLSEEYLATARARRALRLLWREQDDGTMGRGGDC